MIMIACYMVYMCYVVICAGIKFLIRHEILVWKMQNLGSVYIFSPPPPPPFVMSRTDVQNGLYSIFNLK